MHSDSGPLHPSLSLAANEPLFSSHSLRSGATKICPLIMPRIVPAETISLSNVTITEKIYTFALAGIDIKDIRFHGHR